jgi:hypothetical protein
MIKVLPCKHQIKHTTQITNSLIMVKGNLYAEKENSKLNSLKRATIGLLLARVTYN